MKDIQVRDGATTIEALPVTFMHSDGYDVTKHGNDFTAAANAQQGLCSQNHTMNNNFRTRPLGKLDQNVSGRVASSSARRWNSDPKHVQDCIEELGMARCEAHSTPNTRDTMKKVAEAKDSLSDAEVDHVSDETTRKSVSCYHIYLEHCLIETQSARQAAVALSSGESEFYALKVECVSGMLVISCLKEQQLEHLTSTRQTRDPLGLVACQRNGEEVWSGAKPTWIRDTGGRSRAQGKTCSGSS